MARRDAQARQGEKAAQAGLARPMNHAVAICFVGLLLTFPAMMVTGRLPQSGMLALLRDPSGKLGLLALLAVLLAVGGRPAIASLKLRAAGARSLWIALGCGLLAVPMSQALAALLYLPLAAAGARFAPPSALVAAQQPLGIAIGLVLTLLSVSLEELFFRGWLLSKLEPLGSRWAIALSAALFGLLHVHFLQLPWALVLGGTTAILVVRSGSIVPAIVAHATGNALGFLTHAFSEPHRRLVQLITTVTPETTWMLLGSLVVFGLCGVALLRLLRAVPADGELAREPEDVSPRRLVARSPAVWGFLGIWLALNVLMSFSLFRKPVPWKAPPGEQGATHGHQHGDPAGDHP